MGITLARIDNRLLHGIVATQWAGRSGACLLYTSLPNPFSQDIRALFSQEYEAALKGRELIRQELGVEISEDEVSYITLHLSLIHI